MGGLSTPRYAIVGGGFYGCALGLFLRTAGAEVHLFEAGSELMGKASYANQARVHTGFHYPRSLMTAAASLALHQRFIQDFGPCVDQSFGMLYAIARQGSKVGAEHFWKMFEAMDAPIREAGAPDRALFDQGLIEAVFATDEWAFDSRILRRLITERMDKAGVQVHLNTPVERVITDEGTGAVQIVAAGLAWDADRVFITVYDATNQVLERSGLPPLAIKNERTEICLVTPPAELAAKGITVMDGPFFSCMPFPSAHKHSLTHVRYTPRVSWTGTQPDWPAEDTPTDSRFAWMVRGSARYVPTLRQAQYERSLYITKAVLLRNEKDDGRPIALQTDGVHRNIHTVLGGKIDNIYDLFDAIPSIAPEHIPHQGSWLG